MIDTLIYLLVIVTVSTVSDALRDKWRSAYLERCSRGLWPIGRFYGLLCKHLNFRQLPEQIDYLLTRPWIWWRWHIVKWFNLYTPHAFIVYLLWPHLKWYELALTAALMFFVWRRIYNQKES